MASNESAASQSVGNPSASFSGGAGLDPATIARFNQFMAEQMQLNMTVEDDIKSLWARQDATTKSISKLSTAMDWCTGEIDRFTSDLGDALNKVSEMGGISSQILPMAATGVACFMLGGLAAAAFGAKSWMEEGIRFANGEETAWAGVVEGLYTVDDGT